jgi:hypothetical protein
MIFNVTGFNIPSSEACGDSPVSEGAGPLELQPANIPVRISDTTINKNPLLLNFMA